MAVVVAPRPVDGERFALLTAGRAYLAAAFAFLMLPIVTLVVFSFQRNQYASLPGQGWSLRWYAKLFQDDALLTALKNSLVVSPIAATIACVIGFFAAYATHRFVYPGRGLLAVLLVVPVLIPPLILGIAFLGLLSRLQLQGQLLGVILTHVVLVTAPATAIIQLRLAQMPASLEEAAWNLGASEWQALVRVVVPFASAGIAGGWLLAFTFSFDEFVISWFVSGFDPTLPVAIYSYLVGSADPSLNAIASLVFVLSSLVLLGVELLLMPLVVRVRRSGDAVAT